MKTLILPLFFFCTTLVLYGQNSQFTLSIEFETKKQQDGNIVFALYNSEATHMGKTFKSKIETVENGNSKLVIKNIPSGEYSFSYFHDVNTNNKLDTNFMGIPKEPYGFSNNQKGRFGPPDFEESKITIKEDINLSITIK